MLVEDADENCQESDDESDDNELDIFMSVMKKAEKNNEKRILKKKKFSSAKTDWSNVRLDDVKVDEDTADSKDEDDHGEATKCCVLDVEGQGVELSAVDIINLTVWDCREDALILKQGYHIGELAELVRPRIQQRVAGTGDSQYSPGSPPGSASCFWKTSPC